MTRPVDRIVPQGLGHLRSAGGLVFGRSTLLAIESIVATANAILAPDGTALARFAAKPAKP